MGLRTYFNGIIKVKNFKDLPRKRGISNPYTSFSVLNKGLQQGFMSVGQVQTNLIKKVENKFIGLEELVSGGRATKLFRKVSLFNAAAEKLSKQKALDLQKDFKKLKRFIVSYKKCIPSVIERLPADMVAKALTQLSRPVKQRSVIDLKEISRKPKRCEQGLWTMEITYLLVYDEKEITTRYFPGNLRRIFHFERKPIRERGVNRAVVITDDFVVNSPEIFDALGKLETSPLDHILIWLRTFQTYPYSSLSFQVPDCFELELDEFIPRDHFTEKVRSQLHEIVSEEFEKFQGQRGESLTFKVGIDRKTEDDRNLYIVDISWRESIKKFINPSG